MSGLQAPAPRRARRHSVWPALALLASVVATAAHAQLAELTAGTKVRVRAPSAVAGRVTGVVLSRGADSLMISRENATPVTLTLAALTSLEISRGNSHGRGAVKGALWGGRGDVRARARRARGGVHRRWRRAQLHARFARRGRGLRGRGRRPDRLGHRCDHRERALGTGRAAPACRGAAVAAWWSERGASLVEVTRAPAAPPARMMPTPVRAPVPPVSRSIGRARAMSPAATLANIFATRNPTASRVRCARSAYGHQT